MSQNRTFPSFDRLILTIRDQPVILDRDLAAIYEVPTYRFNEAVKRNLNRFPEDFRFQITVGELARLTSQSAMSKARRGGRRTLPWAFTEHGAVMAATVLRSSRAVAASLYVVRAFVRMRRELQTSAVLELRLAKIERTLLGHDAALRDVYAKLKPLLLPPPEPPQRELGFHTLIRKS